MPPALNSSHSRSADNLTSEARADARARVARELHDAIIPSLIAVDIQIELLLRQPVSYSARIFEGLSRFQQLLRQEMSNLRELVEQIEPTDLDPRQLLDCLADIVDKFHRETGISAGFVSEFQEVSLPSGFCRELVLIVQEALLNVRRHSGARNVLVRFALENGQWKLVIDNDGRGFEFSGRLPHEELDAARGGPASLKERVSSVGGELAIRSIPGGGARLEIVFPQAAYG